MTRTRQQNNAAMGRVPKEVTLPAGTRNLEPGCFKEKLISCLTIEGEEIISLSAVQLQTADGMPDMICAPHIKIDSLPQEARRAAMLGFLRMRSGEVKMDAAVEETYSSAIALELAQMACDKENGSLVRDAYVQGIVGALELRYALLSACTGSSGMDVSLIKWAFEAGVFDQGDVQAVLCNYAGNVFCSWRWWDDSIFTRWAMADVGLDLEGEMAQLLSRRMDGDVLLATPDLLTLYTETQVLSKELAKEMFDVTSTDPTAVTQRVVLLDYIGPVNQGTISDFDL